MQAVIGIAVYAFSASFVFAVVTGCFAAILFTAITGKPQPHITISREPLASIKECNEVTSAYEEDEISAVDALHLDEIYSHSDESKLINLIMSSNENEARELISRFFTALDDIGGGKVMANYLAMSLIRTFVKLISNIKIGDDSRFKFDNMLKIIKLEDAQSMKNAIIDVSDSICTELSLRKNDKEESIGKRVGKYVAENYSDHTLDVSKISDYIGLSSSYATKLFKQETGEVLSNYINRIRVDKAKELLLLDMYRIEQIAQMVGYLDSRALSRAFKRIYGLTPSQYKEIAFIESNKA